MVDIYDVRDALRGVALFCKGFNLTGCSNVDYQRRTDAYHKAKSCIAEYLATPGHERWGKDKEVTIANLLLKNSFTCADEIDLIIPCLTDIADCLQGTKTLSRDIQLSNDRWSKLHDAKNNFMPIVSAVDLAKIRELLNEGEVIAQASPAPIIYSRKSPRKAKTTQPSEKKTVDVPSTDDAPSDKKSVQEETRPRRKRKTRAKL